jgi:hypothetical protein
MADTDSTAAPAAGKPSIPAKSPRSGTIFGIDVVPAHPHAAVALVLTRHGARRQVLLLTSSSAADLALRLGGAVVALQAGVAP